MLTVSLHHRGEFPDRETVHSSEVVAEGAPAVFDIATAKRYIRWSVTIPTSPSGNAIKVTVNRCR